jgi:VWFA-related protein
MIAPVRAALTLGIASAVTLSAQQRTAPAPQAREATGLSFRVEVNYVEVDAFVTGADGAPVTDLKASDFELLEEGIPQSVTSFATVNLPVERATAPLFAPPVQPDARSNDASEGRVYVVLLDDLHVHPARAPRVRAVLRQFVEQNLGVNDLAAVVSARGSSADSQDFTNNPRLLLQAIDHFTGSVPITRSEALVIQGEAQSAPADPVQQEEAQRARLLMMSMRRLGEFMAGVRGRRKTVILVSEGVGYDIYNSLGLAGGVTSAVLEDSEKAVSALTRANVTVYTIDPRGMLDVERLSESTRSSEEQAAFRRAQDSLRVLAAETGGFAAVNQNDISAAFDRIVRDNSSYYILGYYPTNERRDGSFRNVDVRVKRPGVEVRSRRGYLAPRGTAPRDQTRPRTSTAEALASPLPVKGIPIRIAAATYNGTSRKAAVELVIEFDPSALGFTETDGRLTEEVEIMHSATDPGGTVHAPTRHGVKMLFKPESFEQTKTRGIRVLSQTELLPGRYQLRAAVGNRDGTAGSVLYDLEIPDFRKGRLEMSGVAVSSAALSSVATVRPAGKPRATLPGPMTASREFDSGDSLVLYWEVYEHAPGAPAHTIDVITELRAADGHALASKAEQRRSTDRLTSGGHPFSFQLDLKNVRPGQYSLHIEARSNLGDRPTTVRDVPFRVRIAPESGCQRLTEGCRIAGGAPRPPGRS